MMISHSQQWSLMKSHVANILKYYMTVTKTRAEWTRYEGFHMDVPIITIWKFKYRQLISDMKACSKYMDFIAGHFWWRPNRWNAIYNHISCQQARHFMDVIIIVFVPRRQKEQWKNYACISHTRRLPWYKLDIGARPSAIWLIHLLYVSAYASSNNACISHIALGRVQYLSRTCEMLWQVINVCFKVGFHAPFCWTLWW